MSTNELWSELTKEPVHSVSFLGRPYITISHRQFEKMEEFFIPSFNILNRWQNYRSKTWKRHIHAIKFTKHVQVHIDHFNPNTFIALSIPHLVFDVVPYFCSVLLTGRKKFTDN